MVPSSEWMAAPCGVDCGQCPLHAAATDEPLKQRLAGMLNLPPERIPCAGCRALDGHCPVIPGPCATWLCVQQKGVDFCSDCADFPCTKLAPCADRAAVRPHNIKVFSLALRKTQGPAEWARRIRDVYALYFKGELGIGHGPSLKATAPGGDAGGAGGRQTGR